MHRIRVTNLAIATALLGLLFAATSASGFINVFGGPTFTSGVGGFKDGYATGINNAGVAIGIAYKFDASDTELGARAFRWDAIAVTELGNLGTDPNDFSLVFASGINNSGTVVGSALTYDGFGESLGERAIRWDASSTVPTELQNLGTDLDGVTYGNSQAINDAGTIVGGYDKYDSSGKWLQNRAVRWTPSSTVATELEMLTTGTNGFVGSFARAINSAGTAVGDSAKFTLSDQSLGVRAVRWDASGTAVTELGNLGTDPNGFAYVSAYAINNAGTTIGDGEVYDVSGVNLGYAAIRWDASGTTATQLGNLGTDADGISYAGVYAINDAGTVVGYADRYDGSGGYLDNIAVRWDSSGTAATALGFLGTDLDGLTDSTAFDINNAGFTVGYAAHYDGSGSLFGDRAVYWDLDGVAVNLNTLIDPLSGWTLEYANFISDTGWITGSGMFDPDGSGGQEAYSRLFLMQIPGLSFLPADYNHDGIVDAADYVMWRDSPTSYGGDPDGYINWHANFGQMSGIGAAIDSASNNAVPEPTCLTLLALFLSAILTLRILDRSLINWTRGQTGPPSSRQRARLSRKLFQNLVEKYHAL